MAVYSGFFNSINRDRLYDANQIGELFEGSILYGVFSDIGDCLITKSKPGIYDKVYVGTGLAFIDDTFTFNSSELEFSLPEQAYTYSYVVLKINKNSRINSIELTTSYPNDRNTYMLASIMKRSGHVPDIQVTIGSEINIITGLMQNASLSTLYNIFDVAYSQYQSKFDEDHNEFFNNWLTSNRNLIEGWEIVTTNMPINADGYLVELNGEIHLVSSHTNNTNKVKSHYKLVNGEWESVSTVPFNNSPGGVVSINYNNTHSIHIFGGYWQPTSHYVYDGTSWTQDLDVPYRFVWGGFYEKNGMIYIMGGIDANGDCVSDRYVFIRNRWQKLTDLPVPLAKFQVIEYRNDEYVFGGFTGSEDNQEPNKYIYKLEYQSTTWERLEYLDLWHFDENYISLSVFDWDLYIYGGNPSYTRGDKDHFKIDFDNSEYVPISRMSPVERSQYVSYNELGHFSNDNYIYAVVNMGWSNYELIRYNGKSSYIKFLEAVTSKNNKSIVELASVNVGSTTTPIMLDSSVWISDIFNIKIEGLEDLEITSLKQRNDRIVINHKIAQKNYNLKCSIDPQALAFKSYNPVDELDSYRFLASMNGFNISEGYKLYLFGMGNNNKNVYVYVWNEEQDIFEQHPITLSVPAYYPDMCGAYNKNNGMYYYIGEDIDDRISGSDRIIANFNGRSKGYVIGYTWPENLYSIKLMVWYRNQMHFFGIFHENGQYIQKHFKFVGDGFYVYGALDFDILYSDIAVFNDEIHIFGGWDQDQSHDYSTMHKKWNQSVGVWEDDVALPYGTTTYSVFVEWNDNLHMIGGGGGGYHQTRPADHYKHYVLLPGETSWKRLPDILKPITNGYGASAIHNENLQMVNIDWDEHAHVSLEV